MLPKYDKEHPEPYIRMVAMEATRLAMLFNNISPSCKHYKLNKRTRDRNCWHGNTKTKCEFFICPLKGE